MVKEARVAKETNDLMFTLDRKELRVKEFSS